MSQLQVTGEAKIRDIQGPVVANSGVITALNGAANQYVRGDGTLASFPTSGGGGSSVSYYLNGSVNQGTFGGSTYYQMSKNAIVGSGTNFSTSANGLIAQFITDANDPDVVSIPSGNWNVEFFMSVSASSGSLASFYVEIYKYNGSTFTLLATNSATPEQLTNTTTVDAYFTSIAMPLSSMAITDRLAIRVFANVASKTVTLYTEDNRLCQVVTTFSKGMLSMNNLTDQSQYLATGTSGTNFAIVSSGDTHTFNLPVASATNTGKLSSTDWSTFNGKQPAGNYVTLDTTQTITAAKTFSGLASFTNTSGINLQYGAYINKGNTPLVFSSGTTNIYSDATTNNIVIRDNSSIAKLEFNNSTQTYTFPASSGTIALTSDISYPVTSVFGRTGAVVATSGDYTTTQVTEGTNLYYTDARARGALSFMAGSGAYNSTTGVITIPTNNNQITNGAGYITSSALSGYLPLTGGTLTGGLNGTTATFSGLGTFYQLTMTGATAGRIFYAQTGGIVSQSGNLNWDNTNEMLGVGTPNPTAVITAFSNNAATQFKASGNAPAFTFSESLTTSTRAAVFGLATANNQFITGTAAGDMAIANQSTTAGAIIFGTGTSEKMRMNSAGRFLIGTSADNGALLQVNGAATLTGALSGTSATFSGKLTIGNSSLAEGEVGLFETGGNYNFTTFKNGTIRTIIGSQSSTSQGFLGTASNHDLLIKTNDATRLTIASTGAATFSSSVTAASGLYNGYTSGLPPTSGSATRGGLRLNNASNIALDFGTVAAGQAWLQVSDANNYASNFALLLNPNGGNVGIGTSSPSNKLTISNNGNAAIAFRINDTNANASFLSLNVSDSDSAIIAGGTSAIPFDIYTGGTQRMRITSGGGVVIGATTTGYKFEVNGGGSYTALFNQTGGNASFPAVTIQHNATSGTIYLEQFYAGATNVGSITTNGTITSYNVSSDYRLKEDFKEFNGLNKVLAIKTYDYKWKNSEDRMDGVIAHELQEVIPYAVSGKKDAKEMQQVDYSKITPINTKAIQELYQLVLEQQEMINELKALIAAK